LVDHGDCLDEDLGAMFAVVYKVCQGGFVGEEVVVCIPGALSSRRLLDGSPACPHVGGVELAKVFGWRSFVVEVVGEWLAAEDVFVTGWTYTHGVAFESYAVESSYLLFHSRAWGGGSNSSHMSSVVDKLLSIWCFECDIVAQDGLGKVGRLCAKVAYFDSARRTFLLRLEV
jgi:hypothetical protein